ncbi:hypothetical protein H1R20_g4539, partial [Candolleomyces eurysporus]
MIAALTPVQTGVEQVWALAVNNFRAVLDKMDAGFVEALSNERTTAFAYKTELEKQQAENANLQDRIGKLEKEAKELKETLCNCSAAMMMAQQDTAKLAGEKGALEIKLKSMEVLQKRLASQVPRNSFSSSSSTSSSESAARTTTSASLMETVQREVSEQVEYTLQAAFRDVQQQRALREQAERKMQAMMRKVKASLADLDVDAGDRPPAPPSREASTAVGTPPPIAQPHSRKPSMDLDTDIDISDASQIYTPYRTTGARASGIHYRDLNTSASIPDRTKHTPNSTGVCRCPILIDSGVQSPEEYQPKYQQSWS